MAQCVYMSCDDHNAMHYEGRNGTARKYYEANGQRASPERSRRVAMRDGTTLYFLLSDHLGSTNLTLDSSGNRVTELRYMPLRQAQGKLYGDTRYNPGSQITTYRPSTGSGCTSPANAGTRGMGCTGSTRGGTTR